MHQQQPVAAVDERRRALLKAGWVVPVFLAVGIPRNAFAQSGSDATGGGGGSDPGTDT